jgi:hypothetical protein
VAPVEFELGILLLSIEDNKESFTFPRRLLSSVEDNIVTRTTSSLILDKYDKDSLFKIKRLP